MATNLTPEQLAALQGLLYQAPTSGSGYTGSQPTYDYTDPSGNTFHTGYTSSGSVQNGDLSYIPTGYYQDAQAGKNQPGDTQYMYDLYGKYLGSGVIPKDTSFQEFLLLGAGLATAGTLTAMGIPGAAGATATMGAGSGAAGTGSGAFLGEGVASGIPAWDAAYTSAGGLLAPAAGTAAGAAGTAAGTAGAAGATSGLSSLLGPAATVLGGLAGAQGQKSEQTTAKDIPEWLKPYVTGNDGLLAKTNSLLQQQTAPGALAGFDQMKTLGMNLLNQPIRPNGFNLFTGR